MTRSGLLGIATILGLAIIGLSAETQKPSPRALEAARRMAAAAAHPLEFIDTSFENASPLYWEIDSAGAVHVYLVYDQERSSPNRANGHWHFRIQARKGAKLQLILHNFDNVWNGIQGSPVSDRTITFVSADGVKWSPQRGTFLEGNCLRFELAVDQGTMYVARLEPHRLSDLDAFLAWIRKQADVEVRTIGRSVEGRPLEVVRVGNPKAPHRALFRARSHAWEPGGNWVLEGLIRRFLADDDHARRWRAEYCLYALPIANVDGVARGRTRFNLQGKDLNRNWEKPADPLRAPENAAFEHWLTDLVAKGQRPDLAIDLHNDESGKLHVSRPERDAEPYLARMKRFEELLRKHSHFTEGSTGAGFHNPGSFGEGLLARYGVTACVLELNANWIAGINDFPTSAAWQRFGQQLCTVLEQYFREEGRSAR